MCYERSLQQRAYATRMRSLGYKIQLARGAVDRPVNSFAKPNEVAAW